VLSPLRSSTVGTETGSSEVLAVDTATIDHLMDLEVSRGSIADVHGDGLALASGYATDHRLGLGDTVTLTFPGTGDVPLTVRALYDGVVLGAGETPYIVGIDTFVANLTDQFDREIYVGLVDGTDPAASAEPIEDVLAGWPNADLQDQAGFKESPTSEIDMMLNLIYGLLALAVVIALIGIANTLALSVHERTRELGLLRAVGMSRRQLRTAIRWESVLISLLGTALGYVLAVGAAWGITRALADDGLTGFVIPGQQLTVIVALAAFAGVLASLGPPGGPAQHPGGHRRRLMPRSTHGQRRPTRVVAAFALGDDARVVGSRPDQPGPWQDRTPRLSRGDIRGWHVRARANGRTPQRRLSSKYSPIDAPSRPSYCPAALAARASINSTPPIQRGWPVSRGGGRGAPR